MLNFSVWESAGIGAPRCSQLAVVSLWQSNRGEDIMALPEGIEINPKVMLGKPVIRGTRIPVELILRKLGEGATEEDLLDAYPNLKREDIRAAMTYAAVALAHEEIL
jgi:uncharacterized protein (DUF433 family)